MVGVGTQVNVTITSSPGFKWEVDINSFRGKKLGDEVISPRFSYENKDGDEESWQLVLYPKGQSAKCKKGFVSVFLRSLGENDTVRAYVISLLDQNNEKHGESIGADTFDEDHQQCGFDFVKETYLRDPDNNILKDNKFTIFCYIIAEEKAVISSNASINAVPQNPDPQHSSETLERLFTTGDFSDWRVTCQGREIKLHRCILATSGTEFSKLFSTDIKQEKDVAPQDFLNARFEVLKELFRFIYTGRVSNIQNIAFELWALANKYKVQDLKALCEEKMTDHENVDLNLENVVDCLNLALDRNLDQLLKKAKNFIAANYKVFIKKGLQKNIRDKGVIADILVMGIELEN